jgi:hydroxymethylglutaryl-CoA lyase
LPERAQIREVGPRDGFQNEPEQISTDDKVRLIEGLAAAGLTRLEVTSFARADVIPQLADAAEVLARIHVPDGVALSVLVPNLRGLERALELHEHFHEVGVFVSASEAHNQRNVNRGVAQSMAELEQMIPAVAATGLRCEAVIAVAFGCPYEGHVAIPHVLELASQLAGAGADEIGFGDTTGMANPVSVRKLFLAAQAALPEVELTAHFHNTRGQGLANVLAAHDVGITSFESSFGELGGCPVPPGSTGNIATEDLVSMFHEMGIETGVDLEKLLAASRNVQQVLGRRLGSHLLTAGPVQWH